MIDRLHEGLVAYSVPMGLYDIKATLLLKFSATKGSQCLIKVIINSMRNSMTNPILAIHSVFHSFQGQM